MIFNLTHCVTASRPRSESCGAFFWCAILIIVQEVVALSVVVPFAMVYMNEPFILDYVWTGLCMGGCTVF
ncbi:MAG: DMT family protein [Rhodoferax sp.]|nr:DMT family protein [Rhodoferax sp.]